MFHKRQTVRSPSHVEVPIALVTTWDCLGLSSFSVSYPGYVSEGSFRELWYQIADVGLILIRYWFLSYTQRYYCKMFPGYFEPGILGCFTWPHYVIITFTTISDIGLILREKFERVLNKVNCGHWVSRWPGQLLV